MPLTIITSVLTSVITLVVLRWVQSYLNGRDRERVKLRLTKGAGGVWRLRNVSGRTMYGVDCSVHPADSRKPQSDAGAFEFDEERPRSLKSSEELFVGRLEVGDVVDVAWMFVNRFPGGEIHTTESWINAREDSYDLIERPITYGRGYGPH